MFIDMFFFSSCQRGDIQGHHHRHGAPGGHVQSRELGRHQRGKTAHGHPIGLYCYTVIIIVHVCKCVCVCVCNSGVQGGLIKRSISLTQLIRL